MGKLARLRKAIEKNPKEWMYCTLKGLPKPKGQFEWCEKGVWHGASGSKSYRNFVRSVLHDLGYRVPYRAPYRSHR